MILNTTKNLKIATKWPKVLNFKALISQKVQHQIHVSFNTSVGTPAVINFDHKFEKYTVNFKNLGILLPLKM